MNPVPLKMTTCFAVRATILKLPHDKTDESANGIAQLTELFPMNPVPLKMTTYFAVRATILKLPHDKTDESANGIAQLTELFAGLLTKVLTG